MRPGNAVLAQRLAGAAVLIGVAFGVSLLLPDPSQPQLTEPGLQRVEVRIDDGRVIDPPPRGNGAPPADTQAVSPPDREPAPQSLDLAVSSEGNPAPTVDDDSAPIPEDPPAAPPAETKPVQSPAPVASAVPPKAPAAAPAPLVKSAAVVSNVDKTPTKPPPPTPKPAVQPSPSAPSAATANPKPTTKTWQIQAGSYADIGNARQVETQLKALGYAATLSVTETAGSARYRIRCGPFATREQAEAARKRLEQNHIPASLVAAGG